MTFRLDPHKLGQNQLMLLKHAHRDFTSSTVAARTSSDDERPGRVIKLTGDYLTRLVKIANNECDDLSAFGITEGYNEWVANRKAGGGLDFVARVADIHDIIRTTAEYIGDCHENARRFWAGAEEQLAKERQNDLVMFSERIIEWCTNDLTNPPFDLVTRECMLTQLGL